MTIVVLATATLALTFAATAPHAGAVSFVDRQVQAGGLLIQNYINTYGQSHQFVYPPKSMVKKGGKLPNSTLIWPANPWTGKIMGPGTSRGTYTYTLGKDGRSYKLSLHLSKGNFVLKSAMPAWFKAERNTASKHNLLLLQRYLAAYHLQHGSYPEALNETTFPSAGYVWPQDPWTGTAMAPGDGLGAFSYARTASGYTLKVKLTTGWSSPALGPIL
jgi:type II secretory pathway pseudopilin PulG